MANAVACKATFSEFDSRSRLSNGMFPRWVRWLLATAGRKLAGFDSLAFRFGWLPRWVRKLETYAGRKLAGFDSLAIRLVSRFIAADLA